MSTTAGKTSNAANNESQPKWNAELGIWENAAAAGDIEMPKGALWIFGYGSLTWKPAFKSEAMRRAKITGFARLFWQRSMDHRGTPSFPGAVVTLVTENDLKAQESGLLEELHGIAEKSGDPASMLSVHGVAFRLADGPESKQILADLDFREKGGYSRSIQTVEFEDGSTAEALVYAGTADNPNFHPLSVGDTAAVIAKATGPSGPNREYLFNLENFLNGSPKSRDPYIETLADQVRRNISSKEGSVEPGKFTAPSKLRGCFVGSGSDGLQLPEVFETIVSLAGKNLENASDLNVVYIGLPSYDLDGCAADK